MPFFQQKPANDEPANNENQDPNYETASAKANAAITNDTIKYLFKLMMKEHRTTTLPRLNPRPKARMARTRTSPTAIPMVSPPRYHLQPLAQQRNMQPQKEGHKDAATLNNKLGGNTDRCKAWRK
jgi:hypothetical protein